MWCTLCNHELAQCTCPDRAERLASIGDAGKYVGARWCRVCDKHYALCACEYPDWAFKSNGQVVDLPPDIAKRFRGTPGEKFKSRVM